MAIAIKGSHYAIKTDNLYLPERMTGTFWVEVKDGRVTGVTTSAPTGAEVVDLIGQVVAPGFIDTHIHGYKGFDIMDEGIKAVRGMAATLPDTGVTSFFPTTDTYILEGIEHILAETTPELDTMPGAHPLGFHMEGPFLSKNKPGAMKVDMMVPPSIEKAAHALKAGRVVMMTVATELPGALEMADYLRDHGCTVTIGHSAATVEQAGEAFSHGINVITHYFNAMSGLNKRAPGLVGAGMTYPFWLQLICDGAHSHPAAAGMVGRQYADRVALITDALAVCGLPHPATYHADGSDIIVDDTIARLPDGTICGSILTLDHAVRNLMDFAGVPLQTALRCAGLNPALSAGIHDRGALRPGYWADIVILDAQTLHVQATIREGQQVFAA